MFIGQGLKGQVSPEVWSGHFCFIGDRGGRFAVVGPKPGAKGAGKVCVAALGGAEVAEGPTPAQTRALPPSKCFLPKRNCIWSVSCGCQTQVSGGVR